MTVVCHGLRSWENANFTIFFALFCFAATVILAEPKTKENNLNSLTSECIQFILQNYLRNSKKIAMKYDQTLQQETMVNTLFSWMDFPIMINAEEVPCGIEIDKRLPNDVVLILSSNTNITNYLERILYSDITVFFTVVWEAEGDIQEIFRIFWHYNIARTFVLHVQKDEILVYYFIPYVNCSLSIPLLLDVWSGSGFIYGSIDKVEKKYPVTSLQGCEFNATLVNVPPTVIFPDIKSTRGSYNIDGIDGRILSTVSEKLNGTFFFKTSEDGTRWGYLKPSPTGAVGDVFLKKSFVASGLHTPNLYRITFLDPVVGVSAVMEYFSFEVPIGAAGRQPYWISIYIGVFSPVTWLCLSVIGFVTVVLLHILTGLFRIKTNIFQNFLVLFKTSIGVPEKNPMTKTFRELFAVWFWYGFIMMTAYESSLKSKLTVPIHYEDLNTIQDLLESDLELFGVSNGINAVFAGVEDPNLKALKKRVRASNLTINEIVEKILTERKLGYLREDTTFMYNAYKNKSVIGQIHRVQQNPMQYYPTMYLQKRCPLTYAVRDIVTRLKESGILLRWRNSFIPESHTSSASKLIKLSLEHIKAPFVAYLIGILISIIVFVSEIIKDRFLDTNICNQQKKHK